MVIFKLVLFSVHLMCIRGHYGILSQFVSTKNYTKTTQITSTKLGGRMGHGPKKIFAALSATCSLPSRKFSPSKTS